MSGLASAVLKRPASGYAMPVLKRPACVAVEDSVSLAACPSSSSACILDSVASIESTCGQRYRSERTHLGLGFSHVEMQSTLRMWGYEAHARHCRSWLEKYRLDDAALDGGVGSFVLSRQDLQRWYHVEGLRGRSLQDRYRSEHGIRIPIFVVQQTGYGPKIHSLECYGFDFLNLFARINDNLFL